MVVVLHFAVLVPVVAGVASLAAYALYASDKRRARAGGRRLPESLLHAVEFLGGWPGALFAQWRLRHKNRKLSFQLVFWLIVAIHVAAEWIVAR